MGYDARCWVTTINYLAMRCRYQYHGIVSMFTLPYGRGTSIYITLLNGDVAKMMNSIYVTNSFFFFFDMSTQEGRGGFELVTSALLGVVPAD
jgi:hypothetical protein